MKVTELYFHPLKSGKAISVKKLEIGPAGPKYDRAWMAVDEKGNFLSQRKHPKMALIEPEISEGCLRLYAPGMPALHVQEHAAGRKLEAKLWKDKLEVMEVSRECSDWLTQFLGIPTLLVVRAPGYIRPVKKSQQIIEGAQVDFADNFPLHLITESSFGDLNARLEEPVSSLRFRPNIVIEGAPSYEEDHWNEVRIGNFTFTHGKPCTRCIMVNVNPANAEAGQEPLKTLATYRKREGGIHFGIHLIPSAPCEISVGDLLTVCSSH